MALSIYLDCWYGSSLVHERAIRAPSSKMFLAATSLGCHFALLPLVSARLVHRTHRHSAARFALARVRSARARLHARTRSSACFQKDTPDQARHMPPAPPGAAAPGALLGNGPGRARGAARARARRCAAWQVSTARQTALCPFRHPACRRGAMLWGFGGQRFTHWVVHASGGGLRALAPPLVRCLGLCLGFLTGRLCLCVCQHPRTLRRRRRRCQAMRTGAPGSILGARLTQGAGVCRAGFF